MFLQVKVAPQECSVLKLLLRSRPEDKVGIYEHTRHVFGDKKSSTCAKYALLQAGIDNKEGHQIAANAIERNFYMDDCAQSVATVEEAFTSTEMSELL